DDDGIAQCADVVNEMAREHDAHAKLAHTRQSGLERAGARYVETVGWLVKDQIPGLVHDRTRQRHLHPFALRESVCPASGERLDADGGERAIDSSCQLAAAEAAQRTEIRDVL